MLYHDSAFYIFGGQTYSNRYQQTIARLDAETRTWSKAGSLKNGRRAHAAIFDGGKFIVLGNPSDYGPVKNEVCTLSGTSMTCEESSNTLYNYAWYPELFLVTEHFGKDISQC